MKINFTIKKYNDNYEHSCFFDLKNHIENVIPYSYYRRVAILLRTFSEKSLFIF